MHVLTHTSTTSFDVPEERGAPIKIGLKGSGAEGSTPPPSALECDIFLAAMGRMPTSANLGLVEAGATIDQKTGVLKV